MLSKRNILKILNWLRSDGYELVREVNSNSFQQTDEGFIYWRRSFAKLLVYLGYLLGIKQSEKNIVPIIIEITKRRFELDPRSAKEKLGLDVYDLDIM